MAIIPLPQTDDAHKKLFANFVPECASPNEISGRTTTPITRFCFPHSADFWLKSSSISHFTGRKWAPGRHVTVPFTSAAFITGRWQWWQYVTFSRPLLRFIAERPLCGWRKKGSDGIRPGRVMRELLMWVWDAPQNEREREHLYANFAGGRSMVERVIF